MKKRPKFLDSNWTLVLTALVTALVVGWRFWRPATGLLGYVNAAALLACICVLLILFLYRTIYVSVSASDAASGGHGKIDGASDESVRSVSLHLTWHTFLEALAAGLCGIAISGLLGHHGGEGGVAELLAHHLVPGMSVGLVIFIMQVLGRATGAAHAAAQAAKRMDGSRAKLDAINRDLRRVVDRSAIQGIAAEALHLQSPDELEGIVGNREALASIDGAMKVVEAMLSVGKTLGGRATQAESTQGRASRSGDAEAIWWQFMKTYFQEEVFDIANSEIATNVRNYAFTLASVLRTALRQVGEDDERGRTRKLAVINVSPFSPKDFYNWPSGLPGVRCYHEAEFFAIYRRALSSAMASDEVEAFRVILSAEDGSGEGTNDKKADSFQEKSGGLGVDVGLGWYFDPAWKLAVDLSRYFVPFYPLSLVASDNSNAPQEAAPTQAKTPRSDGQDSPWATKESADQVAELASADDGRMFHLPAFETRKFGVARVLWLPFVECGEVVPGSLVDWTEKASRRWMQRHDVDKRHPRIPFEKCAREAEKLNDCLRKEWMTIEEQARSHVRSRIWALAAGAEGPEMLEMGVSEWLRGADGTESEKSFAWLKEENPFEAERNVARETIVNRLLASKVARARLLGRDQAVELVEHYFEISLARRRLERGVIRPYEVLDLLALCQRADATLRTTLLRAGAFAPDPGIPRSCFGTEHGPFEHWLLCYAICHYGVGAESDLGHRFAPIWEVFGRDFLGIRYGNKTERRGRLVAFAERCKTHLRVVSLVDAAAKAEALADKPGDEPWESGPSVAEMQRHGITPEFCIYGTVDSNLPKGRMLESFEPIALLSSTLSEPFHTCRVEVKFPAGAGEKCPVKKHFAWVKEQFRPATRSTATTDKFLKDLSRDSVVVDQILWSVRDARTEGTG